MGLLRRKTAVEKERKRKQKAAKKALRQKKQSERKKAREEKRRIRKNARNKKKEVRKSDLRGKKKRDAKKEIRKGKRDDLKGARKEKKTQIKRICREIKNVRLWLDIKLPTKPGNLALLREDLGEIEYSDGGVVKDVVINDAFDLLDETFKRAKVLAARGLKPLEDIVDRPRDKWVRSWSADSDLVKWFGQAKKANHVKDVHDRLHSVDRRLNKQITIRLHPQRDMGTNAQNNGTFFEPKTFKVFPSLFESSLDARTDEIGIDYMASVMIHELMHLWFADQKLNGEKVYSESDALDLADKEPRKARRSAENYERYCLSFA